MRFERNVNRSDYISTVKKQAGDQLHCLATQVILKFNGEELQDKKRLTDYDIDNQSEIHVFMNNYATFADLSPYKD